MGRNRRERREAQAQRAVDSGDTTALSVLAEKSPEIAAQKLAAVAPSLPDTPAHQDELALRLSESLRRHAKVGVARKLAGAFAHRSTRHRLESALCAFAMGDDAAAEKDAALDPEVARVMQPLLDAARLATGALANTPPAGASTAPPEPGSPAPTAALAPKGKRKTRAPDQRPPALRALHALADAAVAACAGDDRASRAAQKGLQKVAFPGVLGLTTMSAALDLCAGVAPSAVQELCSWARSSRSKTASRAVLRALAAHDPKRALDAGASLGLTGDDLREAKDEIARAAPPDADPVARALHAARALGADAYAPEHRATAALYEGFACLHGEPRRAAVAFDRAISLGADLLDALRGKLLLSLIPTGEACPDCGRIHEAGGGIEAQRRIGDAADRFARAARQSGGPAFAAIASRMAAEAWAEAGDPRAAAASIEAVRKVAGDDPAMLTDAALIEAQLWADTDPARADRLLDALLVRSPDDQRAWKAKIEIAHELGGIPRAEEALLKAAEATRDPTMVAMARSTRIQRRELTPFEDLPAGATTPGALVTDLLAWSKDRAEKVDLPPTALARRAEISPPGRVAVDVAHLVVVTQGERSDARRLLVRLLDEWTGAPSELSALAAITWMLGIEKDLVEAMRAHRSSSNAGAALGAVFGAAVAAEDEETARTILSLGALHWSRTEVKHRRRALEDLVLKVRRPPQPGDPLSPEDAADEIDRRLAPEVPRRLLWEDLDPDAGRLDALDDLDDDPLGPAVPTTGPLAGIASFLGSLGLSPETLANLSARQVQQIAAAMERELPFGRGLQKLRERVQQILRNR